MNNVNTQVSPAGLSNYTWWLQDSRTTWWFYGREPRGASIVYIAASINTEPPFRIDIHKEGMLWAYSRVGIDYSTLDEAKAVAVALVAMR